MQRFRGGYVCKAYRLCVSLNSRLESSKEGHAPHTLGLDDPRPDPHPIPNLVHLMQIQFENNCFTEMCSGSEAGSYVRPIDFVCHSILGLRVMKKRREDASSKGNDLKNGIVVPSVLPTVGHRTSNELKMGYSCLRYYVR